MHRPAQHQARSHRPAEAGADPHEQPGGRMTPKWNHYRCPRCQGVTVAMHEADGVTPFLLSCRATPGCTEWAMSENYRGSQADDQKPDVIWYRPETEAEAIAEIAATIQEPYRQATLEHWRMGGA